MAQPQPPVARSEAAQKALVKEDAVPGNQPFHGVSDAGAIQKLVRREQQIPVELPFPATPRRVAVTSPPDKPVAESVQAETGPEQPLATVPATPPAASGTPDTAETATAKAAPVEAVKQDKPANRTLDDSAADQPERADDKPAPVSADTGIAALQEPAAPAAADRQAVRSAGNQNQSGTPRREEWLLDQTGNRYMLQLLGTRYEDALLKFIERHKPDGPLAYYRGIYKGKAWYVLLYGDYPSTQAAIDAIETLPNSISTNHPWPRTLKSIQAAILEARIR